MCLAGLINALLLTGRKIEDTKLVLNGAGAAGIACINLMHNYGLKKENITVCDTRGVIFKGREAGMNEYKEAFARDTHLRTLQDACKGADVFVGVSAAGVLTGDMLLTMAEKPIIFAMANPEPEIDPTTARIVRPDAIVATGRSDYPNQINNVMCFPFLFRGTLDTRATEINEEMKMAAALALAELARTEVPDEVARAYNGKRMSFGNEYIMPTPFDPRLIFKVSEAVAKAAIKSGVAKINITDWEAYKFKLMMKTQHTYF